MLETFSFCGGDLALQNARMGRALLRALASSLSSPTSLQSVYSIFQDKKTFCFFGWRAAEVKC